MNKQSKRTKALIAAVIVLVGMAVYAVVNNRLTAMPQELLGAIAVPFQRASSAVMNKISLWQDKYLDIDKIVLENETLKKQLSELQKKQIDYDKMAMENKEYKSYLSIKEDYEKYTVTGASVIGRDGADKFYSFTIDKGEKHGIVKNNVVVSNNGVIGVVIETGYNYSKVSTILNPSVSIGCRAGETRDNGVVSGDAALSEDNMCIMSFLPKNTLVKEGDIVSTTGLGGVFPQDLIIGTVAKVDNDKTGNSKFATIKPTIDIPTVKMVFIITDYQDK